MTVGPISQIKSSPGFVAEVADAAPELTMQRAVQNADVAEGTPLALEMPKADPAGIGDWFAERALGVAEGAFSAMGWVRGLWSSDGNGPVPPALGTHPLDAEAVSASPALSHIGSAIDRASLRVSDLFSEDTPKPVRAPDPSDLLRQTHAANARQAPAARVFLKVTTYNVALLDARLLGVIPYKQSPRLEARAQLLPDAVLGRGSDVVLLQEVWRPEDVARFQQVAEKHGYICVVGPRDDYNDGLLTLIRKELVDQQKPLETKFRAYAHQDAAEFSPGVGVKRGYHAVSFSHPTVGRINIFNTHAAPYPDAWRDRMHQMRELGLAVRGIAQESEPALVGGDMNSGPYYHHDTLVVPDGKQVGGWWQNAFAYGVFQHYSGTRDLYVAGRPKNEADADVRLGALAGDGTSAWAPRLFQRRGNPHTATDRTNSLYHAQYAGTEQPARMDLILGRGVKVEQSAIVFENRPVALVYPDRPDSVRFFAEDFLSPARRETDEYREYAERRATKLAAKRTGEKPQNLAGQGMDGGESAEFTSAERGRIAPSEMSDHYGVEVRVGIGG